MTLMPLPTQSSANGAASLPDSTGDEPIQEAPAAETVAASAPAPAAEAAPPPAPEPMATPVVEAVAAPTPDDVEVNAVLYARLVLGGLLEGAVFLQQQLRKSAAGGTVVMASAEGPQGAERMEARLAYDAVETMREALATAGVMGMAAASAGQKLAQPVYRSRWLGPLRGLVGQLALQTQEIRQRVWAVGQAEAERSRQLARDFFEHTVADVTGYLGQNQAVDTLVQRKVSDVIPTLAGVPTIETLIQDLVGRYLDFLRENPDQVEPLVQEIANGYIAYLSEHPDLVDALIRQRGDRYLDYLHDENPEAVQELIQGQSLGLAGEVMDQMRERTVTADSLVEATVRAILRRTPREQMPEPSEAVKQQAVPIKLPYRRPNSGEQG